MKSSLASIFESNKTTNQDNDNSNLSFMDKCLYSNNKKISDASNRAKTILEQVTYEHSKCDPELLHFEIEQIKQDLSYEESRILEKFIVECVNSINSNNENVMKRQLKKKGND